MSSSLPANLTPWTWHPCTPGVTSAWLAHANGVSVKTIQRWRDRADLPPVDLSSMTAEMGLEMALLRPPGCVLPMWSRMAMAEFARRGASYAELAKLFQCGISTVWRCVTGKTSGFTVLSGRRRLTQQQRSAVGVATKRRC